MITNQLLYQLSYAGLSRIGQWRNIRPGDGLKHELCFCMSEMTATSLEPTKLNAGDLEIKSILLLDDDVTLLETLKALIEDRNYVVTTAVNGVAGLREVMAMDFDVIICDMMMPTMPGDMFYLAVQKVKPHLCSRFLFVTGQSGDPRVLNFLGHADGLAVFKPVPSDELLQMISLVLKRNEAVAEQP